MPLEDIEFIDVLSLDPIECRLEVIDENGNLWILNDCNIYDFDDDYYDDNWV